MPGQLAHAINDDHGNIEARDMERGRAGNRKTQVALRDHFVESIETDVDVQRIEAVFRLRK